MGLAVLLPIPAASTDHPLLLPIEPYALPRPPDPEPAPSAWPNKALPPGVMGASSSKPCHAAAVASDAELIWTQQPPGTLQPPWLREIFPLPEPNPEDCQRYGEFTRAYTVDGRGEIVRAFLISDRTLEAYDQLQRNRQGSCPIEAVEIGSIVAGKAAYPAHPGLVSRLGFGPAEGEPLL
jgi:hypothetical protein